MRDKARMLSKGKKPEFEKMKEHLENREKDREKAENNIGSSGKWKGDKEATKVKTHTKTKITACNVRGIDTLGERQELARQWEK